MADKQTTTGADATMSAISKLQDSGFGNMLGMNAAWLEALGDLSAELASFVADRIKEDVATQHEILHCKDVGELQHIQAVFIQKAMDQYRVETGKLVEMGTKAFTPRADGENS